MTALSSGDDNDDDDVYYYISKRLRLEGETETSWIVAFERTRGKT